MDDRMSAGELRTIREFLGLTLDALGNYLDVRPDTVRHWESGRDPIPHRVRDEIARLEGTTAHAVDALVDELHAMDAPIVTAPRSEDEMRELHPNIDMPARWYRHVIARAVIDVPDTDIR